MTAIGAKSTYAECPNAPYQKFSNTGDGASPFSTPHPKPYKKKKKKKV